MKKILELSPLYQRYHSILTRINVILGSIGAMQNQSSCLFYSRSNTWN